MLAVAGDSGTMRRRLSGTVADGRVHGKTGTLRDVRALTATAPDGASTDLHVAVLANDIGDYGDVLAARRLADVLALAAAAHVHGCARPVRGRTGAPEAPELLICPRTGR
jgi:D-alanyl-D-alanine carboxypeptidase